MARHQPTSPTGCPEGIQRGIRRVSEGYPDGFNKNRPWSWQGVLHPSLDCPDLVNTHITEGVER